MISSIVREAARRFADRTACVSPSGWSLTYEELDRLADEAAAGLLEFGLTEGDVMALVLPPCADYLVLYVAAARIGAVTAGINHRLTHTERSAVLGVARPTVVMSTSELAPDRPMENMSTIAVEPASDTASVLRGLRRDGRRVADLAPDPDRPVAVVFTSGTTGNPRGAVFAERQLAFITSVDTDGVWGDPSAEPMHSMSGMSMTHLGPMTKLAGNLMRGGTTHLLSKWSPAVALELTERHRMPVIAGVPTQVALMLHHPDANTTDLSSVRAVMMGGGPATTALIREIRERLGVPVMVRYSCTEAGIGVGTSATDPPEDAELSVGRPHAGVTLTIRDESGDEMPDGDVGEVCIASDAVMSGYHHDPNATADVLLADDAVRTGDLGRIDDQGRLQLVGRAKEVFVRGGYNVYPMEVESVLAGCPGVRDVAVVPRIDPLMGEIGVAVIVADGPGATPTLDDLRTWAESRLARHKLPEALLVLDALPLTPMDKLDRRRLGEIASAGDM